MGPKDDDFELLNHFTVLIYPFLHDRGETSQAGLLGPLADRWAPWWTRLTDQEKADALDSSYFFLPHIRGLLYPETAALDKQPPGDGLANWVAALKLAADKGLVQHQEELPPGCVLHWTARQSLRASQADFTVRRPGHADELAARLEWLDAILYPTGLGFLVARVRLRTETPTLGQLVRLNAWLRLVQPPALTMPLPTLRFAPGEKEVLLRDLLDLWTEGLTGPARGATPYTATENGKAYGERCQVLSYACVRLTGAVPGRPPAGPFARVEDRLLFEYASMIGLGASTADPAWVPSPEQAERLSRENRVAVWRCWSGMALKEGVVFLGTEDIRFNTTVLPYNIEADYLPLYLFTLHHALQVLLFSEDLRRAGADRGRRLAVIRELTERFIDFRNRYGTGEVTRKPLGGELHRAFQRGLDLPALGSLVDDTVKFVQDYVEKRRNRQVGFLLNALTLVFAPLGMALSAESFLLPDDAPLGQKLQVIAGFLCGTWALLFVVWRWLTR